MTPQTRETLTALAEILRAGANTRLDNNPHDANAYSLHATANEIVIALALPEPSREYVGASGNDE